MAMEGNAPCASVQRRTDGADPRLLGRCMDGRQSLQKVRLGRACCLTLIHVVACPRFWDVCVRAVQVIMPDPAPLLSSVGGTS